MKRLRLLLMTVLLAFGAASVTPAPAFAEDKPKKKRTKKKTKKTKKKKKAEPKEDEAKSEEKPTGDKAGEGAEDAEADPAASSAGSSSLQRGRRMEFDARLIRGERASGAVFLFQRATRPLPSMVKRRTSYLDDTVIKSLGPESEEDFRKNQSEAAEKRIRAEEEERRKAREESTKKLKAKSDASKSGSEKQ